MRILKSFVATFVACAMITSSLSAGDRAEMADLQARIATLEAATMAPAGGGDAESLTSLHTKKGAVKIGGAVAIDVMVVNRDEVDNESDSFNYTDVVFNDVDLDIRVDAGCDSYVFIKLDLDEFNSSDNNSNQTNDLLEEVKFVWENVRGSNWTLVFGRQEMPFGQDKGTMITDPYVHGGGSVLTADREDDLADATNDNDHDPVTINAAWPGELDNRIGLKGTYKYKELGTLELAVFQNSAGSDDMHEDRSDDNGLQSWAMRVKTNPMEGLNLSASFMNRHTDKYDDKAEWWANNGTTIYGADSTKANALLTALAAGAPNVAPEVDDDEMSFSLAFDYTTKDEKWNFYGEWIYGWHVANLEELSAHVFSLGTTYAFSPKIDINARWDYVRMDNGVYNEVGVDSFYETLHKVGLGTTYTCDNGIYFMAEYAHEWYASDLDAWADSEADVFAFRCGYNF